MALTLPSVGDPDWGPVINTALTDLDARLTAIAASVVGTTGRNYRIVAGTIRNTGSPNYWQPLDDASHRATGVSTVTTSTTAITVNYSFTASKVVSFIAAPDDTLAQADYFTGSSVGTSSAVIYLRTGGANVNPQTVNVTGHNIWFLGVFEP